MRRLLAFWLCTVATAQTHTHGDLVGEVGADRAIVWTRASATAQVSVVYGRDATLAGARQTEPVTADASSDFTAKVALRDLRPDTEYWYATTIGSERGPIGRFRTAPQPDRDAKVVFAFSADVGDHAQNGLFAAVAAHNPAFYVHLGDMPYADGATTLEEFRAKHRETRADAALQAFFRQVPVYAIWDDHEVTNDWDASVDRAKVENGIAAWKEWLAVGLDREIWRSVRWGTAAELFLLDGRSHRDANAAPDLPGKTMLGAEQCEWLLQGLAASTAQFKIVCSSVPLRYGTTGNDHWLGFQRERRRILDFVRERDLRGVVFLCADQHWAAAHDHPEGIAEFQAGPMSKGLRAPPVWLEPEVRFAAEQRSYGLVTIDTTAAEPALAVELFGAGGRLYRGVVGARAPATVRIRGGAPESQWTLRGPHVFTGSGDDVVLRPVAPGAQRLCFSAHDGVRPASLPLSLADGSDADVAVATGSRENVLFVADWRAPLEGFTIVDEGTIGAPSAWFTDQGVLYQSSNLHSTPREREHAHKPGTMAITGDAQWRDVTVRVRVCAENDDAFGVVFRYRDERNYYRLSWDRERACRRLVAVVDGEVLVLAEDDARYVERVWYDLGIVAVGDRLRVRVDGDAVFDVRDARLSSGRVGLYTWGNAITAFVGLIVRSGDATARTPLFRESFARADPQRWQSVAPAPAPASHVEDGALVVAPTPGEAVLCAGDEAWTNVHVGVTVRAPTEGQLGVLFRYRDPKNHYRFTWRVEDGRRQLERIVDGDRLVLYEGAAPLYPGAAHRIECQADGFRLQVDVDGERLCALLDGAHESGRIGLGWTATGEGARFDDVVVEAPIVESTVFAAVRDGSDVTLHGVAPAAAGRRYFLALSGSRTLGARGWPKLSIDDDPLFWAMLTGSKTHRNLHDFVADDGSFAQRIALPVVPNVHGRSLWASGWTMDAQDEAPGAALPTVEIVLP